MTIVRRAIFWVVVVAVVAVWAISQHHTKHYSNVPGQGTPLQRMQLPPLDTAKGGPIPLPPNTGDQPATHYPAQPATVEPPIGPPPPVTDRVPAGVPQDPQIRPQPGNGGAGSQSTGGSPQNPLPVPTGGVAP